ncbi:hypothetical protein HYDPIDRAFT_26828 [Hydnomerulius pinastri MD-312]|nr:hypothetical protein HYDPIDRAFT_26828 [Hydnomerulius pinastri MD-312]
MNPQLIRARVLTLGSFFINFGCQLYGMLSSPNMKEVADANHYAFSPNPYFIAAFFALQVVFAKYEHRVSLPGGISEIDPATLVHTENSNEPEPAQVAYAPIYALGNLCIAAWMVFWANELFWAAQVMVTINTFIQLYAVYYLLGSSSPFALSTHNIPTHLVAKTFAGIGVLDFLDNGAVALKYPGPPSLLVQIMTVLLFTVLAASSDIIFALCMFYNAIALLVGQPTWRPALGVAVAVVGLLGFSRVSFMWSKMAGTEDGRVRSVQ